MKPIIYINYILSQNYQIIKPYYKNGLYIVVIIEDAQYDLGLKLATFYHPL